MRPNNWHAPCGPRGCKMTNEILIGIVSGIGVIAIAGVSRIIWKQISSHRHRSRVRITLRLSDEIASAPFSFYLYRVREGPDTAPLINKEQRFHASGLNVRET